MTLGDDAAILMTGSGPIVDDHLQPSAHDIGQFRSMLSSPPTAAHGIVSDSGQDRSGGRLSETVTVFCSMSLTCRSVT